MSIRKALVAAWRNLVEGRAWDMPRYDDGSQPTVETTAQNAVQAHAHELTRTLLPRLPEHLQSALEHVLLQSSTPVTDPLSLMNTVSGWRTGLGIAIERGGVPSEEDLLLYERLGELELWMDHDLGHPENTQYAVLRRAVERLDCNSKHGAT